MRKIRILPPLCAGILLWIAACTKTDYHHSDLLSDAIQAVDDHPQEALELLESISPDYLYDYNRDQYMQFVVALTQARYMNYQDITGDSLILDAQRYFVRNQNYEMAARASYYAAFYWHEGEIGDKAAEYWQAAFLFAEQAGNPLFMAKSAYTLGWSYYNLEQWDEALPYCRKALELYKDLSNDRYQFSLMDMIGQIYRELQDFEQAFEYFDEGLKAAIHQNNINYEFHFLRNKGIIHWEKKEYRQAKHYFDRALAKQSEPGNRLLLYFSYAKLYRDINRPDSTIYFLNRIKENISEITYPNTRRDIYSELATYYQTVGKNIDEATHYLRLAHAEDLRINKVQNEKKIDAITRRVEHLKHEKQMEGQEFRRIYDYGLIAFCLLVSLLVVNGAYRRDLKGKYEQIKGRYEDIRNLLFIQTVDHQHFLLTGLRSVAKSTDVLYQKAYTGTPVWEQQLILLEEFSAQLAVYARTKLEKLHNGRKAISKLTPEELSIIHLAHMKLSDESIGWMLGYKGNMKECIMLHKEQIRRILADAGMSVKDIKSLLP